MTPPTAAATTASSASDRLRRTTPRWLSWLFAELTTFADPSETVTRVMDYYVFTHGEDDEAAVETLMPLWRESQDYVEEAAARFGIPVAQVFDEFMSPDGPLSRSRRGRSPPMGSTPLRKERS